MTARSVAGALALLFAATTALSACAQASADTDALTWRAEAHPGVAVMPRLTGEGAEALNGLFDRLDAAAEEDRTGCLSSENGNTEYDRIIRAPFTGPRFLSVTVNASYYCGGAHPSVDIRPMTFDRETGGLPDWAALWPGGGITLMVDVAEVPDNAFGYVPTPALVAPIEFTLRRDDYVALGGYADRIRTLADVMDPENTRSVPWRPDHDWPLDVGKQRDET